MARENSLTDSAISYRIDHQDRIVSIGGAWARFADENEARELTASVVVGTPIWKFIAGKETQHLYAMLFASVRNRREDVVIPFRCDSPFTRRYMELVISPLPDHALSFVSHALKIEEGPYVALLDAARQANQSQLVTICSWCKKVRLPNDSWVEVEAAVQTLRLFEQASLPTLTHGICQPCADMMSAAT